MTRLFSIIYFLLLSFSVASAQHHAIVKGRVVDSNSQPVEMVDVMVKGTLYGTSTSADGRYRLEFDADTKLVTLNFLFVSYLPEEKVVDVSASDSVYCDVTLKEDVALLKNVTVKEKRQTSEVLTIPVNKIKEVPTVNRGIEGIIMTQAGVSSNNELSSQYSVRGGNYDENCVYVNNIEVYRPLLIRAGEQEGLSFVNPDMVRSVKFSSGGFSAEYGDKMSSVLDVKYKNPQEFEGSVSVSLLDASVYLGGKTGKLSQIHGARYKSNQYLLGSLDTDGEYKPRFFDYQTYINYDFTSKWSLAFLGNISRNSYGFEPNVRKTKFGTMTNAKDFTVYFDGKEEDLFLTYFGNLALKYKPSRNLELQLTGSSYHTKENVTYDITGEYWLSDVGGTPTLNQDVNRGIGTYHEHARDRLDAKVSNISHLGKYKFGDNVLKWGLTFQHETIDEKVADWEMRDSAGYSMPYDDQNFALYYNLFSDNGISSNRILAYLNDSYSFRPEIGRFVLKAGLRANYWNFNDELIVSPRASLSFFPTDLPKWGFRLAAGMYSQSPFYKEIRDTLIDASGNASVFINKDIKAQRSFQLVLGSDCYFHLWDRPFKFTMEAYGKYMDRLIPYNVDNVKIVYVGENMADGYIIGGDVKLFGEFVPGTDSWVSLSLMSAKENVYGDGVGYVCRPTDQRYNISLFFQDYFPGYDRFKVNLKLMWADGLPFGPPHSERKDALFRSSAYRRVDIGGCYELKHGRDSIMNKGVLRHLESVALGLNVFNLFDINNVNSYYWVTDVNNVQYAVPNYLTGRQLNVRLTVDW